MQCSKNQKAIQNHTSTNNLTLNIHSSKIYCHFSHPRKAQTMKADERLPFCYYQNSITRERNSLQFKTSLIEGDLVQRSLWPLIHRRDFTKAIISLAI